LDKENNKIRNTKRSISVSNGIEFASSNLSLAFKDYGIPVFASS
jgi:hypothetical protein